MVIGVYGASGCGRGILPILRQQCPDAELVFIDDGLAPGSVNGHEILSWESFKARDEREKVASLAISSAAIRRLLSSRCSDANIPLIEARASSVIQMDSVLIGEGACLSPYVTLTSNIEIGRCFHANIYSYIEHDCIVGDYVTLGPGAKINGNVILGDHVYVGSGAVLRQGISIGANAVVGMGAVVTKDVPCGATVVGNPATLLEKD